MLVHRTQTHVPQGKKPFLILHAKPFLKFINFHANLIIQQKFTHRLVDCSSPRNIIYTLKIIDDGISAAARLRLQRRWRITILRGNLY